MLFNPLIIRGEILNLIFFARNKDYMCVILEKISHLFDKIIVLGLKETSFEEFFRGKEEKFILINDYLNPDNLKYNFEGYDNLEDYSNYLAYSKMASDSYIRDGLKYSDNTLVEDNNFRYYLYWNKIIADYNIDCVIRLGSVPHFAYELSLFYLMEFRGKTIIYTWHSGIPPYIYFGKTLIHNTDDNYYKFPVESSDKKSIQNQISDLIKLSLSNDFEKLTPYYMRHNMSILKLKMLGKNIKAVIKRANVTTSPGLIINQIARQINHGGNRYLKLVKTKSVSYLPNKFVYLPLHLQPEASTNPLGYLYNRLPVLIVEVLNLIPKDYKIVIKENPKQTSHSRILRYSDLFDNSRIHIINSSFSTYELISKSSLVISITGTAILEASIMGKNAVLLGNNIYHLLPNVYRLNKSLKENINQVLNSNKYDMHIKDFNSFIVELSQLGVYSPLLSELDSNWDIDEISHLSSKLIEILER